MARQTLGADRVLQGNVDPTLLFGSDEQVSFEVEPTREAIETAFSAYKAVGRAFVLLFDSDSRWRSRLCEQGGQEAHSQPRPWSAARNARASGPGIRRRGQRVVAYLLERGGCTVKSRAEGPTKVVNRPSHGRQSGWLLVREFELKLALHA